MPLMGGRELADRLTEMHAVDRVLYTSGYTDVAVTQQGRLDPSTDFMPKPFTPDSLTRQVRELLDQPVAAR